MSLVVDEMIAVFEGDPDVIMHYGVGHDKGGHSGRFPWGSGEVNYQRAKDFEDRVAQLKSSGWTETPQNIMNEFGLTTNQYRTCKALCKDERRMWDVHRAKMMTEDGKTPTEIARVMSTPDKKINESTVRSWLNEDSERRMNQAKATADFIRERIESKGMIDVGVGVERELNISKEKLQQALTILEMEGYPIYKGGIPQVTNSGQQTNQLVICPKNTEHKEIYDFSNVHSLNEYISRDNGASFEPRFTYPESLDSKRLKIRYAEQGGIDKDGLVELRPGCADLSLGESKFSQVRIMVDNKSYIKGMAVYGKPEDFPPGVDVIFNTNKGTNKTLHEVLKPIKNDPDNPFGSLIKDAQQGGQYWYDSKTGKAWDPNNPVGEKKLGLINKRADEGDWSDWSNGLPSQFLSKQSLAMAKQQLNLSKADSAAEFEEICALTNPTVKKHLLEKYADECDAAAVNLKAAALPGQKYHVFIPNPTLKDNEIYAPGYPNGCKIAVIRYPHGGTFEIPILTNNTRNAEGQRLIGKTAGDAVCINKNVADRLSGADFDGDAGMCIPTHDPDGKVKITSTHPLKGLEGFDPKDSYPERPGMRYMKDPVSGADSTQMEMGKISNLITDMTLAGATDAEKARAVRHSMVVIDAAKHKLDYKQSEIDNGIDELKRKYQPKDDGTYGGAGTLISRAKGEATVERRQGSYKINSKDSPDYDPTRPEGAKIWKKADDLYYPDRSYSKETGMVTIRTEEGKKVSYKSDDPEAIAKYNPVQKIRPDGSVYFTSADGSIVYRHKTRTQKSTRMAEVDDARDLVSPSKHPMELVYADYANYMKTLGNEARKELLVTGNLKYNREAATEYKTEVASLNAKLNTALLNASRERAAQRYANAEVAEKKANDPTMKSGDIKKASQKALSKGRDMVGSVSRRERAISITDKEWEAIQKGAISENKLKQILNNCDIDSLRQRATPKATVAISDVKVNRVKAMANSNYTLEEIATKLGISKSTVTKILKGER